MLGLHEVVHRLKPVQPPDAALAVPAGLYLRHQPVVAVDPDGSALQPGADALSQCLVGRPDAGGQPVTGGVRATLQVATPPLANTARYDTLRATDDSQPDR